MKKYLLILLALFALVLSACSLDRKSQKGEEVRGNTVEENKDMGAPVQPEALGSDRDEHGCIASAGYSWCEAKGKCLRVWEEKCESDVVPSTSTLFTNKSISSNKLGVKVSYYSNPENESDAKEDGNRLYFFMDNSVNRSDYKTGQYLEVFDKDEETSFSEAINNRFLSGVSRDKCFVNVVEDKEDYQKAIIDYPDTPCEDGGPSWACNTCPFGYSKTNGISYFLYFKNHPEKFFYVSIGQYSLAAGSQEYQAAGEWFNNIEFIK